jgi:hypothetical protein
MEGIAKIYEQTLRQGIDRALYVSDALFVAITHLAAALQSSPYGTFGWANAFFSKNGV